MDAIKLKDIIFSKFDYEPTLGQKELVEQIAEFLLRKDEQDIFVLKGYAGTGKTSIIGALVKALPILKAKSILLAPTGRAAKVLSGFSNKRAFTIHKIIYQLKPDTEGRYSLVLKQNIASNTLFIVDEASMIGAETNQPNGELFADRILLNDLIEYVYNGANCKLLLIGDGAQLPPVGSDVSPALNINHLKRAFNFSQINHYELTDVVRQAEESSILVNATKIRKFIQSNKKKNLKFDLSKGKDVIRIGGGELQDALNDAYSRYGDDETIILCRSNKRANLFNQQIRYRIRYAEEELSGGDLMMVVRNNYYWKTTESKSEFIANGDIIQIQRIRRIEEIYGFKFADVVVKFIDYPEIEPIEVKILLDTIMYESAALGNKEMQKLYEEVRNDFSDIENPKIKFLKVKESPYLNALQVKFAYALTCHKSQGGQWKAVFVEQGYLTPEMINTEYYRWLYTAITRATEKLYLVNFTDDFFEEVQ